MNDDMFNEINNKATKIFKKYPQIEYETEGDEEDYDDIDYIIVIKNTNTALLTLIQLRNDILNDNELCLYEFLEEQVADQMADNEYYLSVDFYIKLDK